MNTNILYCFVTHQSCRQQDIAGIKTMCDSINLDNYLVVTGGADHNNLQDHELLLNCADSYEALPEKVHAMFAYVSRALPQFSTIVKLDRTTRIWKPVDFAVLAHYSGRRVDYNPGDRAWHRGKCSPHSLWNHQDYSGSYVPWCLGGPAYFLSRFAANIVAQHAPDLNTEIYEDLYVAKTLRIHAGIKPVQFPNLDHYMMDCE